MFWHAIASTCVTMTAIIGQMTSAFDYVENPMLDASTDYDIDPNTGFFSAKRAWLRRWLFRVHFVSSIIVGYGSSLPNIYMVPLAYKRAEQFQTIRKIRRNVIKAKFMKNINKADEYDEVKYIDPNKLMQIASNKFKVLVEKGTWNSPSLSEEKSWCCKLK